MDIPVGHPELASETLGNDFRTASRITAAAMIHVSCLSLDGTRDGTTVSTVAPISMQPPVMMLALPQDDPICGLVADRGLFCLNFLAAEQVNLVRASTTADGGLPDRNWREGYRGLPYLTTALVNIFCEVSASYSVHAATAFHGRVRQIICHPTEDRMPLIWLHGIPLSQTR